jgi:hypothetical protein
LFNASLNALLPKASLPIAHLNVGASRCELRSQHRCGERELMLFIFLTPVLINSAIFTCAYAFKQHQLFLGQDIDAKKNPLSPLQLVNDEF